MKSVNKYFSVKLYFIPILIFLFAFAVRSINLNTVPNGFHMDEVANTYVGRFILINGMDLYGNRWPFLYFNKFGDYPPVLPMYLSGLATFIFGINTFASRFPAALFGSLIIFPLYTLITNLFSKRIAVIFCLIIAMLPWHVTLSRSSSEGIIGLTVFVVGLYYIFQGINKQKIFPIIISNFFFVLTYLLYPTFRIITPLVLVPLPFYTKVKSLRKILAVMILVFFGLTALISSTTWGRGRFSQTSLFLNPTDKSVIQNDLQIQISAEGHNSAFIARLLHNKVIGYGQRTLRQYFDYFTPHFLFLGDGLPQRYQIPHVGLIYLCFIIPVLWFALDKQMKVKRPIMLYFIYLLIISIIPAAITVDDFPNVHRAIFMIIPLVLFISLSFENLIIVFQKNTRRRKLIMIAVFLSLMAIEIFYASHQYFALSGKINSFYRTDGNIQTAEFLMLHQNEYPEIIVPNDNWLPIYYLFSKNDFSVDYIGKFFNNFQISNISNITFTINICPDTKKLTGKPQILNALILSDGNCDVEKNYEIIGEIHREDSSIAYRLLKMKYIPTNY
jgi:4-amino-4-deoxy-L-arabinose transferase-like glycosyltransferase